MNSIRVSFNSAPQHSQGNDPSEAGTVRSVNTAGPTSSFGRATDDPHGAKNEIIKAAATATELAATDTATAATIAPAFLRRVSSDSPPPPRAETTSSLSPASSPSPRPPAADARPPVAARARPPAPARQQGGVGVLVAIDPTPNDVLLGRGNKTNRHPGNRRLRRVARSHLPEYEAATKLDKVNVVRAVLHEWRHAQHPPGRFLVQDKTTLAWIEVTARQAVEKKVAQTFRDVKNLRSRVTNDAEEEDDAEDEDMEPIPVSPGDGGGADDVAVLDPEEMALLNHLLHDEEDEAMDGSASVPVAVRPDFDCVLGSSGHSAEIQGTRWFWEMASDSKEQYWGGSGEEKDATTQSLVHNWFSKGGRFLRQVKVLKRCSWIVVEATDAVAAVHRFMHGEWILTPHVQWDYLIGRGGETNAHVGTRTFRRMMESKRLTYISNEISPSEKKAVVHGLIAGWRHQGGRFLCRDETVGLWREVDDDDDVSTRVQTYLCRDRERHLARHRQQQLQQQPPAPVLSAKFHGQRPSNALGPRAHAAYMSSHFSGGVLSSSSSSSSPLSSTMVGTASSSLSSPSSSGASRPPKGRFASSWVGRLVAPLLCLFGLGRDRHKRGP